MKYDISVLRVLAYFDLFSHPLKEEEILKFAGCIFSAEEVAQCLARLRRSGTVFCIHGMYSLRCDPLLVQRRLEGESRARQLMAKAGRIGRLLYQFPFVRGVAISGSLSKGVAGPDADIDFFIITSRNRLWIARTFMHVLKKISFLAGRQHLLCMNYYVDELALEIAEKNVFTATEVVTLLPIAGKDAFEQFRAANHWAERFFPNEGIPPVAEAPRPWLIKGLIENLLNNASGAWLDRSWMKITARRWQKKAAKRRRDGKGELMGLITGPHTARPDPRHFQATILARYEEKLRAVEQLALNRRLSSETI